MKLIMIDQKHRKPSKNWIINIPAWLYIATVIIMFIAGATRAEAVQYPLYNRNFDIIQKGIGPGTCTPGPTCLEAPGWSFSQTNGTGWTIGDRHYGVISIGTTRPGTYAQLAYRYHHPGGEKNTLYMRTECSLGTSGFFYMLYYNASKQYLGWNKMFDIPKASYLYNSMPIVYASNIAPIGTRYVRPVMQITSSGTCAFDDIYIY
jgi:hypothetical protein